MRNKLINIVLSIIIFFCGFIISKYFQVPELTLNKQIDGINVLSILISIVIALVFYRYFDKIKEDRVREKELILNRVEEIYQIVNEDSLVFNNSKLEYSQAASSLKRIGMQIKNIENILNICNISLEEDFYKKIIEIIRRLKDLQTDTPYKVLDSEDLKKVDLPLEVKEGIITYSKSRINEINKEYDNLKNAILDYQLKINRA